MVTGGLILMSSLTFRRRQKKYKANIKAGVNMKNVNLNQLFQQHGGGGHAKAASCTIKIDDEADAGETLQRLVDELIDTGLNHQQTVGDFMTSPVLR